MWSSVGSDAMFVVVTILKMAFFDNVSGKM